MRQIVLDTETTGLSHKHGHRVIEVGCVELEKRRLTGNTLHFYINPDRLVDAGAMRVHGITNEFLADKPFFADLASDIWDFIEGTELIIHNAPFDLGFLNNEFQLLKDRRFKQIEKVCSIVDTLAMSRSMSRGGRHTLDALCKKYKINNQHRTLHGALLDSEILADVYLAMTGGQLSISLADSEKKSDKQKVELKTIEGNIKVVMASNKALEAHGEYLEALSKTSGEKSYWQQLEALQEKA